MYGRESIVVGVSGGYEGLDVVLPREERVGAPRHDAVQLLRQGSHLGQEERTLVSKLCDFRSRGMVYREGIGICVHTIFYS